MRAAMVQATHGAARASGGRPVPAANLHVTLAFLGSVPQRRLGELAEAARSAASGPAGEGAHPARDSLELTFDHIEYWRAAQLLCVLPAQPPAAAAGLARRLQAALTARGFTPDRKSPGSVGLDIIGSFRPHVTLARKVYRSPRNIEIKPVTWSFTDFALVHSKTLPEGAVYTVLENFPLEH